MRTATPRPIATITGPDVSRSFSVEIALTDAERARGLMGRTTLGPDEGMLFFFPELPEQVLQFWMKNTLISLDVLFFAADGQFVSLATMEPCEADPCQLYHSLGPATYALEVPGGIAAEMGLGNHLSAEEKATWHLQIPADFSL